ncbi:MAG: class I SAM-dependent methyltransferase [Thermoplasmata archaeon]
MTPPRVPHGPHGHPDHRKMHEAVWTREQAIAALEDPTRSASEDPQALWQRAGLAEGMSVAEVGAGSGFYSFPASDLAGSSGRVVAIDVSAELVEMMRERARAEHRLNLEVRLSEPGRIPLPDAIADRVLLANVLHGIPPATVKEAVRLLRPGGRLIDLDWKKEPTSRGPPVAHRLAASVARRTLERYGLRAVEEWDAGPYHYVVMLEKPSGPGVPSPVRRTRARRRSGG